MSLTQTLIGTWFLGVVLVSGLLAFRITKPTDRMRRSLSMAWKYPGLFVFFLVLVVLTWFVSVPLFYYVSYLDEKREQESENG